MLGVCFFFPKFSAYADGQISWSEDTLRTEISTRKASCTYTACWSLLYLGSCWGKEVPFFLWFETSDFHGILLEKWWDSGTDESGLIPHGNPSRRGCAGAAYLLVGQCRHSLSTPFWESTDQRKLQKKAHSRRVHPSSKNFCIDIFLRDALPKNWRLHFVRIKEAIKVMRKMQILI